jgi:O-antigen/teichoic acid export membrane protein
VKSRLAANAVLNVLAGSAGALFAFVVPALLAGRISAVELSIWSILLQTAVYTAPFTLGIQGVLSRHVALHAERRDPEAMRRTMGAAFRVLGFAAALYLAIGFTVALALGRIYPAIPAERLPAAQLGFVLFLVAQATLIPAAGIAGYFFGLQRNLAVTVNALGTRIVASIGVVALAQWFGLVVLAAIASVVTTLGSLWLLAAWRQSALRDFGPSQGPNRAGWMECKAILRECGPISLWTLASFLVYGGTTTIASTTDFALFPAYSMASAAALVLLGFHSAAMNPLIPHMAVVHSRGGPAAVGHTLARASLISAGISALIVLAYAAIGRPVVAALIPGTLAEMTMMLLPILLFGNAVRLLGLPYANTLVGLGMQGRILWTPVLEAAATFGSALWLAPRYGLVGVAASITLGGAVSITLHYLVNMTVTRGMVPVRRWQLLLQSLLLLAPAMGVLHFLNASGRG